MLPLAASGLLVALLVGSGLSVPHAALVALAATTLTALAALRVQAQPARARLAALVLGVVTGLGLAPPSPPRLGDPGPITVEVERRHDHGVTLRGPGDVRALATLALAPGTTLRLDAELRPRARFRNPSPHAEWPSAPAATYRVEHVRHADVLDPPSPYRHAINTIAARLREGLRATLSPEAFGVARALVLGESEALDEDAAADIRAAGLSHVLAVSGMHVTWIVGAGVGLLGWLLVRVRAVSSRIDPRRPAALVGIPLALIYADLAGSTPSAWRAAVTAAITWGALVVDRRPSPLSIAGLSAIVLATFDPGAALSPGFVLSICSTVAILDAPAGGSPLEDAARLTARAALATAPFSLYVFGGLPWLVVLANLVVVPIAAVLLLPAAVIHGVVVAIDPVLGAPTAALLEPLSSAFVGASRELASLSPAASIPPPTTAQGVVLALAALTLLWRAPWRQQAAVLGLLVLVYAGLEARVRSDERPTGVLRATFLDVGQGDAALVDLPDGSLLVIDTGGAPNGGPDPGERVLVPLLRARRRERIEHLVLTHPHPDHYGGLPAVVEALPVGALWDTGQALDEHPDGELSALLREVERRGVRMRRPGALCGPPREIGGAWLEVLWPCPRFDPGWEPNDNSLVIRLRYGRRTFLFAGDAEVHTEASLAGRIGHVDVLKVPHHGSRTSSTEALLDELTPRIAVISSGGGNRFGHPHPEVLERYARRGVSVLRTDLEGGVVVTTDGARLWADAWSGRHVRPGDR